MEYRAVLFDLFETLITEWGHEKYTKNQMCADLGIERTQFSHFWDELEEARYLGTMSFEESLRYVCEKCGKSADSAVIRRMVAHRIRTKAYCFSSLYPGVLELLEVLKQQGYRLAIVSNCSFEEVMELRESVLASYFDEIVLSCEVQMKKPNGDIYRETAKRLGVAVSECLFVGDGGSSELEGALAVGMGAVQARWYTNQYPIKRGNIEGVMAAEAPLEVLDKLNQTAGNDKFRDSC